MLTKHCLGLSPKTFRLEEQLFWSASLTVQSTKFPEHTFCTSQHSVALLCWYDPSKDSHVSFNQNRNVLRFKFRKVKWIWPTVLESMQNRDNSNTSSIVISLFVSMPLNKDNRPHRHFLSKYIIFCCQTMHMNIICIEFDWKWQRIMNSCFFFTILDDTKLLALQFTWSACFWKASWTTNSIPSNKWRNDAVEYQRMNDWQDEGHF